VADLGKEIVGIELTGHGGPVATSAR
jgi:hypothetical protein